MCRATSRGMRHLIRRRSIQTEVVHSDKFFNFPPLSSHLCFLFVNANLLNLMEIVNNARLLHKIGYEISFFVFFFSFTFVVHLFLYQMTYQCTLSYLGVSLRIMIMSRMAELTKDNDISWDDTDQELAKPHVARS